MAVNMMDTTMKLADVCKQVTDKQSEIIFEILKQQMRDQIVAKAEVMIEEAAKQLTENIQYRIGAWVNPPEQRDKYDVTVKLVIDKSNVAIEEGQNNG